MDILLQNKLLNAINKNIKPCYNLIVKIALVQNSLSFLCVIELFNAKPHDQRVYNRTQ